MNELRWFFTESRFDSTSREIEVVAGGQRKILYLTNDGGKVKGIHPDKEPGGALPPGVFVNEYYPKSILTLKGMGIEITKDGVANLPPVTEKGRYWYVKDVRNYACHDFPSNIT